MRDDPRLYRFVSNLLAVVDPATPPDRLHAHIHEQFREALPAHAVDAFVFSLHEPVLNLINFAYFKAPANYPCPANRPLSSNGGLSDWVILNRRSRLWFCDEPGNDLPPPLNPVQVRYGVPLIHDDCVFGAMMVESFTPGFRYAQEDLEFIDQAMQELSRLYRLYERLRTGSFVVNNPSVPFLMCRIQDERVIEVNFRAVEALGYAKDEILGQPFLNFFAEDEREILRERYANRLNGEAVDTHYFSRLRRKDGADIPIEVFVALGDSFNGRPAVIVTCVDVSEVQRVQREAEEDRANLLKIRRQDSLTGQLNQAAFMGEARLALQRLTSVGNGTALLTALVILDLDNFKSINWFKGIESGDSLLRLVAERILNGIRQYDLLARFDGDRFGLLLSNPGSVDAVSANVQRLLSRIALPYELGSSAVSITASAGVSFFPLHGDTVEALVNNAEAALEVAKKQRNKFALVSDEIIQEYVLGLSYQEELKLALQRGEFIAWYQPKFDRHGRIVGAEALARWASPDRGLLLPSRFISTLERIGMIGELGRQIIEQACRFVCQIHDRGFKEFSVAVNASPCQFEAPDFLSHTARLIESLGLVPGTLELEITESVIMNSENFNYAVLDILEKLQSLGLHISIDDFGTGTSSLTRLRALAKYVDAIKIDKSLVDQIGLDASGDAYFSAILNLARSLDTPERKITFVVEGVETQSQADFLQSVGFSDIHLEFQGFHFARPMPGEQFLELLKRSIPS